MDAKPLDALKLENQLCFPLYACAKEVVRSYKPLLKDLDLTYTQYIAMMVLWEYGTVTSKFLGEKLYLDSGTLTPLLKKLEAKGYINRKRYEEDERNLLVSLTDAGSSLAYQALEIPEKMSKCVPLSDKDAAQLYKSLYEILDALEDK